MQNNIGKYWVSLFAGAIQYKNRINTKIVVNVKFSNGQESNNFRYSVLLTNVLLTLIYLLTNTFYQMFLCSDSNNEKYFIEISEIFPKKRKK